MFELLNIVSKVNNGEAHEELQDKGFVFRQEYVKLIGFFILSIYNIRILEKFLSKDREIIDLGCGSGALVNILDKLGYNIVGVRESIYECDNVSYTDKIVIADAVEYLQEHNTGDKILILSWPPYNQSMAYDILQLLKKGQTLIYIGEGYGGCTADDQFFDELNDDSKYEFEEVQIEHFEMIYDRIIVIRRL